MSSSVSSEGGELLNDTEGKLNWTDLTGLADGGVLRDFTVSIRFKQRTTVVDMDDWSQLEGLEVTGVTVGVGAGFKEEAPPAAEVGLAWPMNGRTV